MTVLISTIMITIMIDYVYSGSVRLQATAEHFIPSVKPYVSESNVAAAICLPIENHKVTNFEGNSFSCYLQSLKVLDNKKSAYNVEENSYKKNLGDHCWPCKTTCTRGNCNSSKENMFEDFTSRNATGIYMYVYMYLYIYGYACIYTYICICMYIRISLSIYIYICIYVYVYIYMYIYIIRYSWGAS
jgi:hypothetical protein